VVSKGDLERRGVEGRLGSNGGKSREREKMSTRRVVIKTALSKTLQLQGWEVIAGARPLNEENLRKTLQTFNIPQAGMESIGSKLSIIFSMSTPTS